MAARTGDAARRALVWPFGRSLRGHSNWLLVGLFDFDLVAAIFGDMTPAARVVYVLVGIAAIWTLISSASLRGTPRDNRDRETTRLASR